MPKAKRGRGVKQQTKAKQTRLKRGGKAKLSARKKAASKKKTTRAKKKTTRRKRA